MNCFQLRVDGFANHEESKIMRAIAFATDDKRFVACMPFVLEQEGVPGNSDDPHDPGGRTHEGIIQTEYNAYRHGKGRPLQSVYLATDAEVDEIYYTQYWKMLAYKMPPGLDLSVLDNDMNEGIGGGCKVLQRTLGVAADGQWGIISQAALDHTIAVHGLPALITSYAVGRLSYYRSLGDYRFFHVDWNRRTVEIRDESLKMVVPTPIPAMLSGGVKK
jgi:lysozyme family protein